MRNGFIAVWSVALLLLATVTTIGGESGVTATADVDQAKSAAEIAANQVTWSTIASGGNVADVGSYRIGSTLGQTASGTSSIGGTIVYSGYWQNFDQVVVYCCGKYDPENRTGNIDYDPANVKDLSDILTLASWAFIGGPEPPCLAEGNVDGDGGCAYDLSDCLTLARYCFLGGEAPAYCMPTCE